MSTNIIQKMFEHTTQYARLPTGTMLKKALGLHILPSVFTGVMKMSSVILSILTFQLFFDGSTTAVTFFGTSSKVTDLNGIKHENQFANTFEDTIIQ
jgi:quinol-cytochrome oxidoreductase complex cytochrome b subunit